MSEYQYVVLEGRDRLMESDNVTEMLPWSRSNSEVSGPTWLGELCHHIRLHNRVEGLSVCLHFLNHSYTTLYSFLAVCV